MVVDVVKLTPAQREAFESLLGRAVTDGEQVQVSAFQAWKPPMSRDEAIQGRGTTLCVSTRFAVQSATKKRRKPSRKRY